MITTASELLAALKGASAGAILVLAPGNYNNFSASNANPAGTILITSEYPDNPAVFSGNFTLSNTSNITFKNVTFDFSTAKDPYWPGRLTNVKNVTLDGVRVTSKGPDDTAGGFYAADTDRLTVVNSTFDHIGSVELNVARAKNLTISGNDFAYWNKSAVGIGQVQGLTFTNNTIHDSFPAPGTHPDGLQIFTFSTKQPSTDLRINDNRMWAGTGGAYQGIFIQDETKTLPFSNVEIQRNCLVGTMWNSIYLKNATGNINILDNIAFSYSSFDPTTTKFPEHPVVTNFKAGILIWLTPDASLTEKGNQAQTFSGPDGKWIRQPLGNTLIGPRSPAARPEPGVPASSRTRAASPPSKADCA